MPDLLGSAERLSHCGRTANLEVQVMCDIPLELERKFKERWAARLARPVPPSAPHEFKHQTPDQHLAAADKAKMKTRRAEAVGLRSVAAACERGD